MKYIIVLGDGMADEPLEELGNCTPLEVAKTPTMDAMALHAEIGMAYTVPDGMSPGSDTANLSVMGYDPKEYYTGRSPIEALSIGVDMKNTDVSFRCNVVTLSEEQENYEDRVITDHSAGEITTKEATQLIDDLKEELKREGYAFYAGTSYRHLLVWEQGEVMDLVPPHDILTSRIGEYLPKDDVLREMMEKSYAFLVQHPINIARKEKGLNPANSAWFWGAGTKPGISNFEEKTGKKGAVISAVDLLKGIAVGAQMQSIDVEGADGSLHTNYMGKAQAALHTLLDEDNDFVYIHVEAPDEMGHQGLMKEKIQAIEWLDEKIIAVVKKGLDEAGVEYRMLVLPDHPTPIRLRTHTANPIPYMLYDSSLAHESQGLYNEKVAETSRHIYKDGYKLIDHLFE
ncbi:MAG: cofactor-independent phosphoglycerate mutase [Eubacteriales bacterium]